MQHNRSSDALVKRIEGISMQFSRFLCDLLAIYSTKGAKTSTFPTKSSSHLILFVKLPCKFLFSLKQSYKNQFTGDIRSFCSS